MRTSEVVVVGGGVVGASAAFFLAREGIEVTLLERDALASGASGAAAGMLTPTVEATNDGPALRFGLRSLDAFEALAAELLERSGVDCEFVRSGTLHLAFDEAEAHALRARVDALPEAGLAWLEPGEVAAAEPLVAPGLSGALWASGDAHVRSPLLTRAYAGAARRLGARIETGVEAIGLRLDAGRVAGVDTTDGPWTSPRVVLCTGAWSGGGRVWPASLPAPPVEPVRGQILSLEAPTPAPGAMIAGRSGYAVPKRDGTIVVGATEERVGFDPRVTADGLHQLLGLAATLVPALGDSTFRSAWAGLRPGSPDGLPLVGPLRGLDGLALATGHHRSGVLLSPVTGRLVADWVAGKGCDDDARAFLPSRFESLQA